ncbi:MAG: DNA cytosine methyltransferase [Kiritimatiellae bacterium]|nr:DNA cytosine methyltransferase [Kiritimatiellia bacterium]
MQNAKQTQMTTISLFSGAEGLDIGVRQAGSDILACETLRLTTREENSYSPERMKCHE